MEWENDVKKCMAGLTSLRVDPQGRVFLCELIQEERYSLLEKNFEEIWNLLLVQRKKAIEVKTSCSLCSERDLCGMCAPCIQTEYGSYMEKPYNNCKFSMELKGVLGKGNV